MRNDCNVLNNSGFYDYLLLPMSFLWEDTPCAGSFSKRTCCAEFASQRRWDSTLDDLSEALIVHWLSCGTLPLFVFVVISWPFSHFQIKACCCRRWNYSAMLFLWIKTAYSWHLAQKRGRKILPSPKCYFTTMTMALFPWKAQALLTISLSGTAE